MQKNIETCYSTLYISDSSTTFLLQLKHFRLSAISTAHLQGFFSFVFYTKVYLEYEKTIFAKSLGFCQLIMYIESLELLCILIFCVCCCYSIW